MAELAEDIPSLLDRAAEMGVFEVITIGIDLDSSRKAVQISEIHENVYATAGIHPHDAFEMDGKSLEALRLLARHERVVAIGEIGLDYYRNYKPHDLQKRCFRAQLRLACEEGLPVVFHIRDAYHDFFQVASEYAPSAAGLVFHCFSGDWRVAEKCLELGGYLSIPGTVTFPKATAQHEVVQRTPLDRLLVETDAPYLAPIPYRGKVNEPAFVRYTAQRIAELKGITLDEVVRQTTENARKVFKLPAVARNEVNS
jgi:TatD DNase family protein